MPEQNQTKEMTAAEAAKLVFRELPAIGKDGRPNGETKREPVKAGEVLAFRDHGDHVVVVTKDGQKLIGDKAAK